MLRAIPPRADEAELAYRVPWRLSREPPRYELVNAGEERVLGVTLAMLGSGRLVWGLPGTLGPGEGMRFGVQGDELERDGVVVVRWFRESGEEYLWRVSF